MRQYRRMPLAKSALGMLDNCSAELRPWYQYRAGGWPRDTDSITLSEPALPNRLCSPSPPRLSPSSPSPPIFAAPITASDHHAPATSHPHHPHHLTTLSPLMCRTGACCSQRPTPARVPPAPGGLFVTSPLPLTSSEQEQGCLQHQSFGRSRRLKLLSTLLFCFL
jgi:hypothetical protein